MQALPAHPLGDPLSFRWRQAKAGAPWRPPSLMPGGSMGGKSRSKIDFSRHVCLTFNFLSLSPCQSHCCQESPRPQGPQEGRQGCQEGPQGRCQEGREEGSRQEGPRQEGRQEDRRQEEMISAIPSLQ